MIWSIGPAGSDARGCSASRYQHANHRRHDLLGEPAHRDGRRVWWWIAFPTAVVIMTFIGLFLLAVSMNEYIDPAAG